MENEKDNKYYICHYCCDYMTPSRKDMKKHFNRKKNCKCLSLLSYDDAKILTLSKQFILLCDIKKLLINDKNYIVQNYTKEVNIIPINFIQNNIEQINKNEENEVDEENELNEDEEKEKKN